MTPPKPPPGAPRPQPPHIPQGPAFARQPRDESGPVFAEAWQAQAFALAVQLSEAGRFTWPEWSAALGAELKAAAERGEPDDGSRYYEHWLAALEKLVAAKGLAAADALRLRRDDWAEAYRATPHGKPVELGARRKGRAGGEAEG